MSASAEADFDFIDCDQIAAHRILVNKFYGIDQPGTGGNDPFSQMFRLFHCFRIITCVQ